MYNATAFLRTINQDTQEGLRQDCRANSYQRSPKKTVLLCKMVQSQLKENKCNVCISTFALRTLMSYKINAVCYMCMHFIWKDLQNKLVQPCSFAPCDLNLTVLAIINQKCSQNFCSFKKRRCLKNFFNSNQKHCFKCTKR